MNNKNWVEFKIPIYKNKDWDNYKSALKQEEDRSEDLGIVFSSDEIELPRPIIGTIKLNPDNIIYYHSSFSMQSSMREDIGLDCTTIIYKLNENSSEDITVYHTYDEFEEILNKNSKNTK